MKGKTACRTLQSATGDSDWQFLNQPNSAVGQIYFVSPTNNEDMVCSGTLINADTVLTAGHCGWDKDTQSLNENIVFAPGSYGVQQSNGAYAVNWLTDQRVYAVDLVTAYNAYLTAPNDSSDTPLDYAFMHLSQPVSGVATYPAAWDIAPAVGTSLIRIGYPAEGYWGTDSGGDGEFQAFCNTSVEGYETESLGYNMTLECPLNGGSSGGPVFAQLSDGTWAVVSVMSRCARDGAEYCETNETPYFDSQFGALWQYYEQGLGATPPTVG